ncbi:hypothetical protein [Sporomusa termitida]|uniref:Uncharacterized protein n=1 Tax=Sporomusa termitida TaxID=2377 RepID=A0A517DWI4_9FIRM|nr:hypothetical protein [Sporomusa termitida]QDR81616.1 hypothetical protein SPTER_30230 [Sporomusa termitida]
MKKTLWSIQARAFRIPYTPFSHNFWALVNPTGKIADQIHGLAYDPKAGITKALGNSSHFLHVVHDAAIIWSLQPNQPTVVCSTGPESEICNRWQAALNSVFAINALNLPYPNLWQHLYKMNSNTIFNTIGQIMGVVQPGRLLPTLAPGIKLVVSQAIIDLYGYKARPANISQAER